MQRNYNRDRDLPAASIIDMLFVMPLNGLDYLHLPLSCQQWKTVIITSLL